MNQPFDIETPTPKIYSVSDLTKKIKALLEENFPIIWISGEISNLKIPASGHAYFVLKDEKAQISAVMFKGQLRQLKFKLDGGISIIGMGRISVYEPRGTYQLIVEYMEPQGYGALQIAFEQMKKKLAQEGLFDADRKKPLPALPNCIGLVTSSSGAVVHDMLNILVHRFPKMQVEIYPVLVQGKGAEDDIVHALSLANRRKTSDVLILARGGGSLEDLAAFNSEAVARAIFNSEIPVISAVGHETDFTIADFVADLRAPTPTAAAQTAVPNMADLFIQLNDLSHRCRKALVRLVQQYRRELSFYQRALVHPSNKVQDLRLRIDELHQRLSSSLKRMVYHRRLQYQEKASSLLYRSPKTITSRFRFRLDQDQFRIQKAIMSQIQQTKDHFVRICDKLMILNPQALLQKGYSITRTLPDQSVLTDSRDVQPNQLLEILLANGRIDAIATRIHSTPKDHE